MKRLIIGLFAAFYLLGYAQEVQLEEVKVQAARKSSGISKKTPHLSGTTLNKETIDSTPTPSRGLTDLLKGNPNVQFGNSQVTSKNLGEIDPQDISINGAKFYQNNFMVDGFNVNNDLDPSHRASSIAGIGGKDIPDLGSISQGVNLDPDLVENLTVYDSSVSAKYGGFQGGVISAKTRNPRRGFHGKVSVAHSRDAWTSYHIDELEHREFYNSFDPQKQPRFQKWKQNLLLDGHLTDKLGLLFSYSRTYSKIPLVAYRSKNFSVAEEHTVHRENENYLLKLSYHASDRLMITPSILYAPSSATYFRDDTRDSFSSMKSGGITTGIATDYELDFAKFSQKLGYSVLESSKDAEKEYWFQWIPHGNPAWWKKLWGYEGGYGDVKQEQKTLSYEASLEVEPLELVGIEHRLATGIELKSSKGTFEIPKGFFSVSAPKPLPGGSNCLPDDPFCSANPLWGGATYYHTVWQKYLKGKVETSLTQISLWAEDEMKIENLTLRPGLRFDSDSYMKKNTLAPRFASTYDLFGDGDTLFTLGANRYYGRSSYAYALKGNRDKLKEQWVRRQNNAYSPWVPNTALNLKRQKSDHLFRELKIPYDDELALGVSQNIANFNLTAKYVHRRGRDLVVSSTAKREGIALDGTKYKDDATVYTNRGKSRSDVYTLKLKNIAPYEIGDTRHNFEFVINSTKTKSNVNTYDTANSDLDGVINDPIIKYNGKYIRYSERPAQDFNRPWTAQLSVISQLPSLWHLVWANSLRVGAGYEAVAKKGTELYQGEQIDVYGSRRMDTTFTWDTKISLAWDMPLRSQIFVNVDILNILDRKNITGVASKIVTARPRTYADVMTYETGRQFWLETGYRW
ncbi:MAG: TonB-dependent receptor plug domain-containing protein [Wolinella sp.]